MDVALSRRVTRDKRRRGVLPPRRLTLFLEAKKYRNAQHRIVNTDFDILWRVTPLVDKGYVDSIWRYNILASASVYQKTLYRIHFSLGFCLAGMPPR